MQRNSRGCRSGVSVSHEGPALGDLRKGGTGGKSEPNRVGRSLPAPAARSGGGVVAGSEREPGGAGDNPGRRLRGGWAGREAKPAIIHACNSTRWANAGDPSRRTGNATVRQSARRGTRPGSAGSNSARGFDNPPASRFSTRTQSSGARRSVGTGDLRLPLVAGRSGGAATNVAG